MFAILNRIALDGLFLLFFIIASLHIADWIEYYRHERPVYWSSPKPDPYQWDTLAVEVANFGDRNGCRRERLREFDAEQEGRWIMYYELIPDPIDVLNFKQAVVAGQRHIFVVKLYANRRTMGRNGEPDSEWLDKTKRMLTDELMWLLRPCEETPSQFYRTVYPNGVPRPAHIAPSPAK